MKKEKLSKQLAYVLRHKPESVGLTLDSEGWVSLASLSTALQVPESELMEVVKQDSKQRFTVRGSKIRAAQGHTIPVSVTYTKQQAPAVLWHGTTVQALPSILREGLKPMQRTHVHLSPERAVAVEVGSRRKSELVVLKVNTAQLQQSGHELVVSENGVWLVDYVPPVCLEVA